MTNKNEREKNNKFVSCNKSHLFVRMVKGRPGPGLKRNGTDLMVVPGRDETFNA